jgi:hypothetical protein
VSGKSVLKLASSFIAIVLLGGLLTSCGASEEEKALKANCDRIFANLKAIGETPEAFRNLEYADERSVTLLLGEESRKDVERKIIVEYPFLDEIIVGREKGKQQPDAYYYAVSIFIIAEALKGTDVEFPYSREEMLAIATQENGWRDVVDPLATKIFGDYMELKDHQGCAVIDQIRVEESTEGYLANYNTSIAFSRASDNYIGAADTLQAIRNCEISGWNWTEKCAKVDYVSKPSTYVPSDEPTEEEKEILAEREADAEREAQNPSSSVQTSNVTPGQICSDIGQMVETKNYGSLTCKIVFLNRIKALVWMRS